MTLDGIPFSTTVSADTAAAPARRPAATAALVLFVGARGRPGASDSETLAREGMRCLWLPSIAQAIEAARMARFDALVLDAGALEGRGGATLAHLRAVLQCPVVLLADRGDEVDEIVALELGADAYLSRPVAPRRLRAHLAALLRLRAETPASEVIAPASEGGWAALNEPGWRLDRIGNRLRRGDSSIDLTEVQSALLQCLIEARGRIVARERLLDAMPLGQAVHLRSVDVYIHRLRKRLRAAGAVELLIEAIRGRGYVMTLSPQARLRSLPPEGAAR